ncbi:MULTISPECIES: hypothetical protein [unclassified Bradyrhizobium]
MRPIGAANCEVTRAEFDSVGLAMRAERKAIDESVDGLKFHSRRVDR